jgi:hypothetical protein
VIGPAMSPKIKIAVIGAAAIILAALITGAVTYFKSDGGSGNTSTQKGNGNANNQGNGCVIQGSENVCGQQQPNQNENPSAFVKSVPPTGPGPWQFIVVNTVLANGTDIGLTIRRCNVANCGCSGPHCERLGFASEYSAVFAVCKTRTNFDAGTGDSPIWFKVKWPNNRGGSSGTFESSRGDAFTGWAFGSYLAPQGHNGEIPNC